MLPRSLALFGLAVATLACGSTSGDGARAPEPLTTPSLAEIGSGARLYAQYCASCHGIEARGDGPVARVLATAPADLTRLAARYGTPLPKQRLAEYVDGRDAVAAHGPREMPVWGKRLYAGEHEGSPAKEAATRGTILLILDYLETLQRPAAPAGR